MTGLIVLALAAWALIPLESWVHRHFEDSRAVLWSYEHVTLPLLRTIAVAAFLLLSYPQPLFPVSLEEAPHPSLSTLINILSLAGLALPLLPLAQRFTSLVLAAQTLIGAWLLRGALAQSGVALALSGYLPLAELIAVSIGLHFVLRELAPALARRHVLDVDSVYDALSLAVLPPLVLIVTRQMG